MQTITHIVKLLFSVATVFLKLNKYIKKSLELFKNFVYYILFFK